MKTTKPTSLFIGWVILAIAPTYCLRSAESRSPGSTVSPTVAVITGQVSNLATGAYLEGATVRVAGTDHVAYTERDGSYRLSLPPGDYTLVASYTGLDSQQTAVTVSAGLAVRRDFGLTTGIYKLSPVVVPANGRATRLH